MGMWPFAITTGLGTTTGAGLELFCGKEENEKISKKGAKKVAIGAVAALASTLAAETINGSTVKRIHEQYADAYVSAMSDEKLEEALIAADLLEADLNSNTDIKTI